MVLFKTADCPKCDGTGNVAGPHLNMNDCPRCAGTGTVPSKEW